MNHARRHPAHRPRTAHAPPARTARAPPAHRPRTARAPPAQHPHLRSCAPTPSARPFGLGLQFATPPSPQVATPRSLPRGGPPPSALGRASQRCPAGIERGPALAPVRACSKAATRRRGGPPPMREEVEGLRAIAGLPASPSAARRRHTAAQAAWQRHGGGRRVSRWELAPQGQWRPTGCPARSLQPAFDLVFCLRARHTVYHPWLTGGGGGRPGTEAASRTPSAPPLSPTQTQVPLGAIPPRAL